MMVRFKASGIVAMVLFIPILLALGIVLAFIVPLLAIMTAAAGIAFTAFYATGRLRLAKRVPDERPVKSSIEVKDYKVR